MKEKVFALDFLRALAIACILLTHLSIYFVSNPLKIIFFSVVPYFADVGLGLFLFISGYLLYHNTPKLNTAGKIKNFYKTRFLRIYPLYWIAIVIFFVIYSWFGLPTVYSSGTPSEMFSPLNIIITASGLQMFFSPAYGIPVFTLYFIGVIILCYSLYPLIIRYSKNFSSLMCYSALFFLLFIGLHAQFNLIGEKFFLFYPVFISGIAVKYLSVNQRSSHSGIRIILPLILVFLLIIESRTSLIFDERVIIAINIPNMGIVDQNTVHTMLMFFASGIGLSSETLILIIKSVLFDLFVIVFCCTQLTFSELYADQIKDNLREFISVISIGSYCIFLFHDPILTVWTCTIEPWIRYPLIQDLVTIFLIVPFIIGVSYSIQKYYSSHIKKISQINQ